MTSKSVDIGVLEEKNGWLLHPQFYPSKVGGKPAWLNLKDLPSPNDILCKKCRDPLIFLCQIYAPYEETEECFHRTIFIFICRNGSCCQSNCPDNFIVLRCQLSRKNDFYSHLPYEEIEQEEFSMDMWPKLCNLCGAKAPSHCSKCKKVFYCSRKHQILDWSKEHKEKCRLLQASDEVKSNNFVITDAGKSILFKEWELLIDEEDEEDVKVTDTNEEMEKMRKMIQEKKVGSLNNVDENELEQYAQPLPEDKVFNKFNKRIARHPEQVLRYDRGGTPLWMTSSSNDSIIDVPKCPYCHGERQFEFQVMPQLLNFIDVGIDFNSIDWGILVVYTCKSSCSNGPAYKEEFMIKQDLLN